MANNIKDHDRWLDNLPEKYKLEGKDLSTDQVREFQDFYRSRYIVYIQQQCRISLDKEDPALRGVDYSSSENGRQFCYSQYRQLEAMYQVAEEIEEAMRLSKEEASQNNNVVPNTDNNNNQNVIDDENVANNTNDENLLNNKNDENVPNNTDGSEPSSSHDCYIVIKDSDSTGDSESGESDVDERQDPMTGFSCINNSSDDNNPIYDFAEVPEFELSDTEWFEQLPKIYLYAVLFGSVLQMQRKQQSLLSQILERKLELQEPDFVILKYVYENPVIRSVNRRERTRLAFEDHHFNNEVYRNIKTDFTQRWPIEETTEQSSFYDKTKATLAELQIDVQMILIKLKIIEYEINFSYKNIQRSNLANTLVHIRERFFYFSMVKEVSILKDPSYRRSNECKRVDIILKKSKNWYRLINYLFKNYDKIFRELRV